MADTDTQPRAPEAARAGEPEAGKTEKGEPAEKQTADSEILRVLVVDDNAAGRLMFQRVVQKLHPAWEVQSVDSADKAIGLLDGSAKPFDWIALDVVMPETDGIELATTMVTRGIPADHLIILSASEYELKRVEKPELAGVRQMLKPVRTDKLAALLAAPPAIAAPPAKKPPEAPAPSRPKKTDATVRAWRPEKL